LTKLIKPSKFRYTTKLEGFLLIDYNVILHNPIMQGAGLMSVGGMALAFARSLPTRAVGHARKLMNAKVYVGRDESNQLFESILRRLREDKNVKIRSSTLSVGYTENKMVSTYLANDDIYRIKHDKRRLTIQLHRDEKKDNKGNSITSSSPGRVTGLTITSHFISREKLEGYMDTFVAEYNTNLVKTIRIYKESAGAWYNVVNTDPRSFESLIYEREDLGQHVMSDMKKFLNDRQWYKDMNIPHRRGYLLYGTPGNGKTSFIRAIASELEMNIALLDLSTMRDDANLTSIVNNLPTNTILVLEDVDAMGESVKRREGPAEPPTSSGDGVVSTMTVMSAMFNASLSSILNAIDGLVTSENRIIFMTTNHKERIDPALIRPGRCDMHLEIISPSKKTISRVFNRFFPDASAEEQETFINRFEDHSHSMAHIQSELLIMREDKSKTEDTSMVTVIIPEKNMSIAVPVVTSKYKPVFFPKSRKINV
jgi:ATP-dependent 26S proteasome regulatory subunit